MSAKVASRRTLFAAFFITGTMLLSPPVGADARTDGTLGPVQDFSGDFTIDASVGTTVGANLFHSFGHFSVGEGESATFTGPGGLENVISRVTGGDESIINGPLTSLVPNADFWFINPAGVLFGANAEIDVPGSFHLSTADELRFEDGAIFSAVNPGGPETLTVASPAAFGFLSPDPGDIEIEGSLLSVSKGQTLSLVGGDITVDAGSILSPGGTTRLVSVGASGEAPVTESNVSAEAFGDINLRNNAVIDTSGDGGGKVFIRGGNLVVEDVTRISASNTGAQDSTGGVEIEADDIELTGGSRVITNARDDGSAGNINVRAENEVRLLAGSQIGSTTIGSGQAGTVSVEAHTVKLTDGSIIDSTINFFGGVAGRVEVRATDLELRGSQIKNDIIGSGQAGTVSVQAHTAKLTGSSQIGSTSQNGGTAGLVDVRVTDLELRDQSTISSTTLGDGPAGEVRVDVKNRLSISGSTAGVTSTNASLSGTGAGGTVVVHAREIELIDGGAITTSTIGPGNAGDVSVTVEDRLVVAGRTSRIGASSLLSTGAVGTVTVTANKIEVRDSGSIGAENNVADNGGKVMVRGDVIEVLDGGFISTRTLGTGPAGNVEVTGGDLVLRDGGSIRADTEGQGDAGEVFVKVNNLVGRSRYAEKGLAA